MSSAPIPENLERRQCHQLHHAGAGEEPAAPACRQTFAVLQQHPSRQNSVAPVRAQQGWRAAVQRANRADCIHSRCPVTTSNGLSAAGTRGNRLWATVTRWWVHRVVDPARSQEPPRELRVSVVLFFGAKYLYYKFRSSYISTQEPTFESVSGMSVLLVIQVIKFKTDVTKYMCIFSGVYLFLEIKPSVHEHFQSRIKRQKHTRRRNRADESAATIEGWNSKNLWTHVSLQAAREAVHWACGRFKKSRTCGLSKTPTL